MLFNSFHFLVFFIAVTSLYFALPHRFRWQMLLAASCYFYMVFVPVYILILGGTIVVDYFAGILIEKASGRRRKLFLICSLVANVGVLAVFKYYNFLNENLGAVLSAVGMNNPVPYLSILLPIGLSFHTFQAMSYTIEVYRGNQKAERHFGIYSLYVMFYPQLVAGPIERPQNLLPQFHAQHSFNYSNMTSGLRLMAWGLIKKTVIADRLSIVVDHVYNDPTQFNSLSLLLATVFFTFQIYCDFSGYSDMAIGAARTMGFHLMKNFNAPYFSRSVSEFWKRWHISLSTWFKDYLYITLGGNRVAIPRMYLNLFIVFLVSGLWHGANWTYIIWGALHGTFLVVALMSKNLRKKINHVTGLGRFEFLSIVSTFALVSLAWVFFRANTVEGAVYIITHIFSGMPSVISDVLHHRQVFQYLGATLFDLKLSFVLIPLLLLAEWMQIRFHLSRRVVSLPLPLRWGLYYSAIVVVLMLGVFDDRQFIYFQF